MTILVPHYPIGTDYAVYQDGRELGRVQINWDEAWVAYRHGGGPIGDSDLAIDRDRHGYAHRNRRDAIAHLIRATS